MNPVPACDSVLQLQNYVNAMHLFCGPGSVVGIATDYGLDGPGIESRWGRDFTMGTGSFPGGKVRPGRAADPSPPSSAEVLEE